MEGRIPVRYLISSFVVRTVEIERPKWRDFVKTIISVPNASLRRSLLRLKEST
jgi:hypothetical protein